MSFWLGSNCDLFFTDQGTGTAVVFVHGWMCDSHDWSWQIPVYASAYRVIAVDTPGHGRSSPSTAGYHPDTLGQNVRNLLAHAGAGKFVVIGHSLGAVIATRLAARHPHEVLAVVSVDPSYGVREHDERTANHLRETLRRSRNVTTVADFFDTINGPHTSEGLRMWHRRRALGGDFEVAMSSIDAIYEPSDQMSLAAQTTAFMKNVTCPVLAIHRDPTQAAWERATFVHPLSKSVVFRDVGHWIHQESVDNFNQTTLEWLESVIHSV